jgi:hypothetical protein
VVVLNAGPHEVGMPPTSSIEVLFTSDSG